METSKKQEGGEVSKDAALMWIEPPYFKREGFDAFKIMQTKEDDVIMASYPKCGTSWMHQIIFSLLRIDDHGNLPAGQKLIGKDHQVYPASLLLDSQHNGFSGRVTFNSLIAQRAPRLFSTHSRAGNLPKTILDKGRLVIIARNPKDAFISMFFFDQKYKKITKNPNIDKHIREQYTQWVDKGMEHMFEQFQQHMGPDMAPIGFGDYFSYYKDMLALLQQIGLFGDHHHIDGGQRPRGFLTFYETLHSDFDSEIKRLAAFLGVTLTREKFATLKERVSFQAMAGAKLSGGRQHFVRKHFTIRKGVVGDHMNYLSAAHWARADELFRQQMLGVKEFHPLFGIMNAHKRSAKL